MTSVFTASAASGASGGGKGSLTVGGTGIASIAHFTLETVTHLKSAERVFYLVFNPAIQSYIRENNANTTDLAQYYDEDRNRYESHLLMSEVILRDVRDGRKVFAIIYGHPGVTASPAHRALAIARQEGYAAIMLPGISMEDCMFATLEIDPALRGWTTSEASELVAGGRQLNPSVHNIILNVGNIGEREDNSSFSMLVDRLEANFGPDHRVLHYLAEDLPQSSTAMVAYSIIELRADGLASWILPTSALYIPPIGVPQVPAAAVLGLPDIVVRYLQSSIELEDSTHGSRPATRTDLGGYVQEAQTRLSQHVIPRNYKSLRASSAMQKFMIELSLEPELKQNYKSSPENRTTITNEIQGVTDRERLALQMGDAGPVAAIMLRSSDQEPTVAELERIDGELDGRYGHPVIVT